MRIPFFMLLSLIVCFNANAEETETDRAIKLETLRGMKLKNDATERDLAAGVTAATNSANCEAFKNGHKEQLTDLIQNGKNELKDGDTGTNAMRSCVSLTQGNMRYLYNKGRPQKDGIWDRLLTLKCIENPKVCDPISLDACKKAPKLINEAITCDSAAYIISKSDRSWENPEHVVTKDVKGGNPTILCQGHGVATLDYDGCVKFVQKGDVLEAAQVAINAGQQLYYQDKTLDEQAAAAKSDNSATAALQAMKSGVKSQKEIMEQRAAMDTGKLAFLANYYNEMPTVEDVVATCNTYELPTGLNGNKELCKTIVRSNSFAFLDNQQAKERMKAKLIQVGINVGSQAVMAGMLAKRESDLGNAIANVESFKPIDPLAPQMGDATTTYCQTNPGDPKCLSGGLDRTFSTMDSNVITFGDGGTGTSFSNNNPIAGNGSTTTNAVSPTNRNSIGAVGGTIAAANQASGLANPIAAGTITKGNGPSGGSSGAPGGGSGGSSGGGGGGPAAGAQAPTGSSSAIAGKTPSYSGGTGFSLVGGSGLRAVKKTGQEKDENPFGKLFDKNKNGNGTLNFNGRVPASVGNKGDNIFDMISKRYATVSSDKRLIEYELAK